MSLTLYYAPGACSFVPHCLLEASGATYEPQMVKLHKGEQYDDAYKSINPRSQVPVLKDGDQVITQIVAICLYLDTKFPSAQFLPTDALARAKATEAFA
jgi:glutathione S-transferase